MKRALKVGAAQFDAKSGDLAANLAEHERLIAEAAARAVDLMIFPELSLPGYAADLLDREPVRCLIDPQGPELARVRDACRKHRIAAVVGGGLSDPRGMTLSSLVVDRQGEIRARYDKRHIDPDERAWFVPGDSDCLLELEGWRLGLGICYDSSFPEQARSLALRGADAYLVSGAFMLGASDRRRAIYFPARALENTLYVAFANYVGSHAGLELCGHSAIYGPDGQVLADAGAEAPGLACADLDPQALARMREKLQMLRDRKAGEVPLESVAVA